MQAGSPNDCKSLNAHQSGLDAVMARTSPLLEPCHSLSVRRFARCPVGGLELRQLLPLQQGIGSHTNGSCCFFDVALRQHGGYFLFFLRPEFAAVAVK